MDELRCNACGKVFSTKYNLRKHVEALHLKLKPYDCPLCRRQFAYQHSRAQHLQAHVQGKRNSEAQTRTIKALGELLTQNCPEAAVPLPTAAPPLSAPQTNDGSRLPHVHSA